jgi:hypothetical protein
MMEYEAGHDGTVEEKLLTSDENVAVALFDLRRRYNDFGAFINKVD